MKKKNFTLLLMVVLISAFGFGCGDDNNDSSDTSTYESLAGKYDVESSDTYSSIELTESGNYIILGSDLTKSALTETKTEKKSFLFSSITKTRSTSSTDESIYGTYTVNSDGTLNLNGFGTLEIVYESDGTTVLNMILTATDGSPITLGVSKEDGYSSSDKTNTLCQTWNMGSFEEKDYKDDVLIWDLFGEFNVETQTWSFDLKVDTEEFGYDEEDCNVSQVLFAKSGTYLLYFLDGTVEICNWEWKDESAGTFYYKDTDDEEYDEDDCATVSFSGGQLTVVEGDTYSYNDVETSYVVTCVLNAVD